MMEQEKQCKCYNFERCQKQAEWFCVNDEAWFCEDCKVDSHQENFQKNHKMVRYFEAKKSSRLCQTHSDLVYCQPCTVIVCGDCHFDTLPDHKVVRICQEVFDVMKLETPSTDLIKQVNSHELACQKREEELKQELKRNAEKRDGLNQVQVLLREREGYWKEVQRQVNDKELVTKKFRDEYRKAIGDSDWDVVEELSSLGLKIRMPLSFSSGQRSTEVILSNNNKTAQSAATGRNQFVLINRRFSRAGSWRIQVNPANGSVFIGVTSQIRQNPLRTQCFGDNIRATFSLEPNAFRPPTPAFPIPTSYLISVDIDDLVLTLSCRPIGYSITIPLPPNQLWYPYFEFQGVIQYISIQDPDPSS